MHRKRFFLLFGVLSLAGVYVSFAQTESRITRIVLDAGHGGKDPGALGKRSMEKDIVLAIALKTGEMIRDTLPDIDVIFTRKSDEFIELHRRARIANESGADIFISIHCNSNTSSTPFGAETYVMGLHKTSENLEVAKIENAAIFFEEDFSQEYGGFDPNSDEDYIVLSMFQSSSIDQSIDLASRVQEELKIIAKRKDRGVKQAGFWVLYKTTMPGILIETGFLSNPAEEEFISSVAGQDLIARAICSAFLAFRERFEETNSHLVSLNVATKDSVVGIPLPEIRFRVQFASYKKEKDLDFRKFRGLEDIRMYEHDGMFKYTTGNEQNLESVQILKKTLTQKGYKDVFIVAFLDGKRISLEEAQKITENKR
ncbi:MAG: N-acetylmuramoyl-L-alanine amidase [Bacteroidales bacterium]|nr:N-acetylmuramoyl-L-alanine amidase [Bacteroidales bacterium]